MPSVRCPGCQAGLKLKAAPPAGKKLRCPKCGAAFAPKVKRPAAEAVEILDDDFDDCGSEPPPPSPRARRASGKRAAGGRSSGSGGGGVPKAVWFGLGGLIAAAAVGAVLLTVFDSPDPAPAGPAGGGAVADGAGAAGPSIRPAVAAPFPTAYLPADSDFFLHLKVAEVWDDPLVVDLTPTLSRAAAEAAVAGPYRVAVRQIESVTVASPLAADFSAMAAETVGAGDRARELGRRAGTDSFERMVAVVRLSLNWDAAVLADPEGNPVLVPLPTESGAPAFTGQPGLDLQSYGVWQPDPRTVVVGTRELIAASAGVSGGLDEVPVERPGFAAVPAGRPLVVVLAAADGLAGLPGDDVLLKPGADGTVGDDARRAAEVVGKLRDRAAGLAVAAALGDSPGLAATAAARSGESSEDAERVESALSLLLELLREGETGGLPPAWAGLIDDTLAAAAVTAGPDAATLTLPLPGDLRDRAAALAAGE